jgi:glycosyltransferase involved in cell wall biosynthesis
MTRRQQRAVTDSRPLSDLSGLRVIIANWRDPWHPEAGGAERYAWEMACALAARGAQVRFVTARGAGQSRGERRDGIEIIRLGGRLTVYPMVLAWLLAHRGWADAVLDCQCGIPFFTPLVLPRRVPVLCLVHHVHTDQFGMFFPGWMARIGRLLEGPVARMVYWHRGCVAVSPSTVKAMRERLHWNGDIYLVPNGTPLPTLPPAAAADPAPAGPEELNRLVWIGRLVAHKRVERIVPVAARGFTVEVVGKGPGTATLAAAIEAAPDLAGEIHLHGFVPDAAKEDLVSRSLLHLSTSSHEGWGLTVVEAAALGVPTVAYDVEGIRDAVLDGETGWLVKDGEDLADVVDRAAKELADPARREAVAAACRAWAASLSWGRSTARMAELISASVRRGTSRGTRVGAWVLATADGPEVIAEGPVLDVLLDGGGTVNRQATPIERLLGEVRGLSETADSTQEP